MSIETIENKSGDTYRVVVWNGNKRLPTKTFDRRTDAKNYESRLKADLVKGIVTGQKVIHQIAMNDLAENFFSNKIDNFRTPKTAREYRLIWKNHIEKVCGNLWVKEVEEAHADKIKNSVKHLKPNTINKIISVLRQILKYGVRQRLIPLSPLHDYPEVPVPESPPAYYTEAEVLRILNANFQSEIYPILLVLFNTGLRIGEILGLCWDCVDLEERKITIKRNKRRDALVETTKTKRYRILPMNENLFDMFKSLKLKRSDSGLVFVRPQSLKAYEPDHFSERHFKKATQAAGVRYLSAHKARHTFATNFRMKDGRLDILQNLLGHSKQEMTRKYAHCDDNLLRSAGEVVSFKAQDGFIPNSSHSSKQKLHIVE